MAFFNVRQQNQTLALHDKSYATYTGVIAAITATESALKRDNENVYETFPVSELFSPTRAERSFFVLSIAVLFVLSMCGNLLTLVVNLRRKMRPFFRTCLISLACSDLITTFFFSITFMSQFSADYVQYWNFSETMCHMVPFMTACAIMVSSLTLLGIAADRYFAVRVTNNAAWNPSCGFCLLCLLLIWAASITICSPIYFIYEVIHVYVIDDADDSDVLPQLVAMCGCNKDKVGLFYMVIFFVIFMPCIVAFLWLNTIVAISIWQRRRPPSNVSSSRTAAQANGQSSNISYTMRPTTTTNCDAQAPASASTDSNVRNARTAREQRHIRLFIIIIVMMLVFLVCRLPVWILSMLRMYSFHMNDTLWRSYFYFGILHLSSCMLNPIFYTFLSETIEYAKLFKLKVFNTACGIRLCCERTSTVQNHMRVPPMPSIIYGGVDDLTPLPTERVSRFRLCCRRTTLNLDPSHKKTNKRNKQTPNGSTECDSTYGNQTASDESITAKRQQRKCSQQIYTINNSTSTSCNGVL